ncbi:SAM-dependent methyltransferase [Phytohabitans houttuyneae]|uniref:SAM-dependent methyltransferase n=1 Tax=Phytohabitans houttuyneae TaxID=1076126 RepID=UPI0031EBCC7A
MTRRPGTPAASTSPAAAVTGSGHQPIDTSRPHPARRYDYWLGGKDNVAADRESADQIAEAFPHIRTAAQENRRFMHRTVAYLAAHAGIHQYLDIGTGFPTSPNVHELAQATAPGSRVVYVDNDPVVVVHARALMTSTPEGATAYIHADLRQPNTILNDPALTATLDFTQPVALLLIAVLHFLDNASNPYAAVARLLDALPSGSYLAVSHATFDPLPADTVERLTALSTPGAGHGTFRPRTRAEVNQFLHGLELVEPGLVPIVHWRPDSAPKPTASVQETAVYGAVARLP